MRNPYNPVQVSRYKINPEVVDVIGFCTKNPKPFFPYLDLVKEYGQFWYVVTIHSFYIRQGKPIIVGFLLFCVDIIIVSID